MLNYSLDFNRLSQAYALGQLEPEQVVHDVDRQINALAHNPIWIHRQPLEAVLQRVSEIKALKARGRDLPLYGLPFAVKDNIDVKGCQTTAA
jgi:allophanate hydrolase